MKTCLIDDCKEPARSRGLCNKHYSKEYRDAKYRNESPEERDVRLSIGREKARKAYKERKEALEKERQAREEREAAEQAKFEEEERNNIIDYTKHKKDFMLRCRPFLTRGVEETEAQWNKIYASL